jgi:hypothetical protein
MKFRFGILLLFACLSLCPVLSSQTVSDTSRSDYALLWEISGKDLPAPSYVFGSMHVRYKSAFEFPDSLLLCLQACDAVANEVHLDSAMQRIVQLYVGGEELAVDSSYIRFIHEKILRPDSNQIASEPDSAALDFRTLLKGLGEGAHLRKSGFMTTMLDAYLMEVGRSLGKKNYGLEEIDEHMYEKEDGSFPDHRFSFSWFSRNQDELLRLYYAGDLGPIGDFIESDPREFNQLSLIARNYIMVERMIQIMPQERLFSIVGAAHLPGKEGVLELLRNAGYTVRRVTPTFTGQRDSFLIPKLERPWPEYKGFNELFTFTMPLDYLYEYSEAAKTSYFSFDIGRGASYLLTSSSILPLDYEDFDDQFFVQDGYEIQEKTPLVHNGLEGFQYDMIKPGEEFKYYRGYTFSYDQNLYYLEVGTYEEDTLEELAGVDSFLQKFQLLKKSQEKWVTVRDTLGGFELRLPDHYAYSNSKINDTYSYLEEEEYSLHVYRAGFEATMASVWCQYYDFLPGQKWENEATQLQEGLDYLEVLYGIDLQVTRRDSIQGYPRWLVEGEFLDKGLLFYGQLIARSNRLYLLSQVDTQRGRTTKKFFSSFKLLPVATSPANKIELIDDGLTITLPVEAKAKIIDLREYYYHPAKLQYQLLGVDPSSSANYLADVFFYPSLISIKDTLAFLEKEIAPLLQTKDELIGETSNRLKSGQVVYERTYSTGHVQLQKRIQYYHYDRYWVRKQMIASVDELYGQSAERFFEEDVWQLPPPTFNLFTPRTNDLYAGLQSQDSLRLTEAIKVLDPALSLDQEDLPGLKKVFLENSWETYGLTHEIANKLLPAFLTEGEYGQQVLQQIYEDDQLGSEFRLAIIAGLATADQPEGYQLLFRLLERDDSLTPALAKTALAAFDQNPTLTLEYWSSFSRLLTKEKEPLAVWELASQVLEQNSTDHTVVLASQQLFIDRSRQLLADWTPDQGKDLPEAVFGLLGRFSAQAEVLQLAHSFYERPEVDWASLAAASYLFEKGVATSKRKWKQILKKDSLQIPFLRLLNEYDLLEEVNKKFYQEEKIARFLFLEEVTPTGIVSELDLLDIVEVLFRGEVRRAYVFSFSLDEEENHLGVTGLFSRDLKQRGFLDEGLVNFTLYTISPRRRARKVEQLLEELEEISKGNGVYFDEEPMYTPFK